MNPHSDLGRFHGLFIPSCEIQSHLSNGWRILDDMAGSTFAKDEVLMAPPADLMERGEAA